IYPSSSCSCVVQYAFTLVLFFSSRRRHTKSKRDWSSDVCSSDLPEHYAQLIAEARRRFDLVIVDTQITEALDTSGLIDRAVGPALARGGYALGMVELSTPGVEYLLTSMAYLRGLGADPARMMTIVNNVSPGVHEL